MRERSKTYKVPSDMTPELAREKMSALQIEIRDIESALGDRSKDEEEGYEEWRRKAKTAWSYKLEEYRALKFYVQSGSGKIQGAASSQAAHLVGKLRQLLDAIRPLEEVYRAAEKFVDEDTEEAYEGLEIAVNKLRGEQDGEGTGSGLRGADPGGGADRSDD